MPARIALATLALVIICIASAGTDGPKVPGRSRAEGSGAHKLCKDCHATHDAQQEIRLLKKSSVRETCLQCHSPVESTPASGTGSGTRARRVEGSDNAVSVHPGMSRDSYGGWQFNPTVIQHRGKRAILEATCSGCHDTHLTMGSGFMGRTIAFDPDAKALDSKPIADFDICFGCHGVRGGWGNVAQATPVYFGRKSRSAHPVGQYGNGYGSISLAQGVGKTIFCGSCHYNSDYMGLSGPHFSQEPSLLGMRYETRDGMVESEEAYALCYSCHLRSSILGNMSFSLHKEHITGIFGASGARFSPNSNKTGAKSIPAAPSRYAGKIQKRPAGRGRLEGLSLPTSCNTCHDPHGDLQNMYLIRFNRDVVSPASNGLMLYRNSGPRSGECTLSCHGYEHLGSSY